MGGSWKTREYLWMFNEVELFQIGVLVDWVVGLGLRDLEVKILIRSILAENHSRLQQYMPTQRSQGHGKIAMQRGRSPGKEEGIETESTKSPMNAPMTRCVIVIQEKIGTTETVIGVETGGGRGWGHDHGCNRAGIVIWTVVVITTGYIDGIAIVKGIGTMIAMTMTMTMTMSGVVPMIGTMMLSQNMNRIGLATG
ncbi:hypothetical protein CKAN_00421000 [Cinnamomum micranthum f. kanehirae]|uniref:Uncharacterized protein n=1 Tax=Cinnamomum micranthum f. kanehirae TaxID=337451 RepID=A0A3S3NAJ1_9MAGN|nr:hypothetical protein CKAN_00421000 [Cinnamomum micranthum f. kanehirae]